MAAADPIRPRLSPLRQAMLSFFWLGTNAHWAAILITTLPNQALRIGGDEVKGRTLSTVLAVGALVSMLVAPLFGALSGWSSGTMSRPRRSRPSFPTWSPKSSAGALRAGSG